MRRAANSGDLGENIRRRYLRPREVVDEGHIGSLTSLWREVRAGRFPRPISISPGAVAFIVDEIEELERRRIAERDAAITHPPVPQKRPRGRPRKNVTP